MAMFGFLKKKKGKEEEKVPAAPDMPPPAMQQGVSQDMQSANSPSLDIPNIKLPDDQQPSFDAPPKNSFQAEPLNNLNNDVMNTGMQQPPPKPGNIDDFSMPPEPKGFDNSDQQTEANKPSEPMFTDEPKPAKDLPPIKPVDFDDLKQKDDITPVNEEQLKEPEFSAEDTDLPGLADDGTQGPTPEAMEEPVPKPMEEPAPEPMEEPISEPAGQPTPEAMEEPAPKPMEEPSPEAMEEPAAESIKEPISEPQPDMDYMDSIKQDDESANEKGFFDEEPASQTVPSRSIINDALFVNLDDFREIVELINTLGNESKMADETLLRVKDITISKEKVYDKWQTDMELVEKEFIQLDKLLFKM